METSSPRWQSQSSHHFSIIWWIQKLEILLWTSLIQFLVWNTKMNRIKAFQYHTLYNTHRIERTIAYFKRSGPSLVFQEPTFSGGTTAYYAPIQWTWTWANSRRQWRTGRLACGCPWSLRESDWFSDWTPPHVFKLLSKTKASFSLYASISKFERFFSFQLTTWHHWAGLVHNFTVASNAMIIMTFWNENMNKIQEIRQNWISISSKKKKKVKEQLIIFII